MIETEPVVRGLSGMAVLFLSAWLCSENRQAVRLRQVCIGLLIQLVLAVLLLKLPFSSELLFLVLIQRTMD